MVKQIYTNHPITINDISSDSEHVGVLGFNFSITSHIFCSNLHQSLQSDIA